ncbi:tripartite tricarboxylate transporter permease [Alkalihalophilus pseudofirmus]|uniref:Tripartite tricarboxylate transporter permease n=1 Tax=Alkalihalophilus pseudofirmus TaxID=79885 RepID=A0AAJ2NNC3_ALKPS|nr:tripartite tricarboxylate transporter permease [Alkalihalophilus pseudofirmus]MDV2885515.1 tripartite tricarboxylate transporter permease [Alkalihalophilus pseudofirmus]
MFELWLGAIISVFTLTNILAILCGVLFGIFTGALPGLSSTMALAIIIPFTFSMDPATGLILLGAVYSASVYAGSISAILLNTPGTPSAAATVLDGYEMTKKGLSARALGLSAIASGFGGIVSVILLSTVAPFLALQSLRFGPPEYFALAVFGLTIISSLAGKNPYKGLLAGALGIFLATVGMDPILGYPRFTFGSSVLVEGFTLIPVLIGLFSASQAFSLMISSKSSKGSTSPKDSDIPNVSGNILPKFKELLRLSPNMGRSSIIGTSIGIIPGVGTDPAAFIAYNEAKRWSKEKDQFGKGSDHGLVAPEASNNAVTGGSLIPLLSLGIPGNAVSAVFLGGLLIHGLRPGAELFVHSGNIVYALFFSLFIANILVIVIGIAGARAFSKVLVVKPIVLGPIILILSIVGSYAIHNNYYDIWIMLAFGLLGFMLRRYGFPLAPIVLALILGPKAETSLSQSMLISQNDWTIFFTRPLSAILLVIAVITFITPFIRDINKNKNKKVA